MPWPHLSAGSAYRLVNRSKINVLNFKETLIKTMKIMKDMKIDFRYILFMIFMIFMIFMVK